jgi:hypothetical protein
MHARPLAACAGGPGASSHDSDASLGRNRARRAPRTVTRRLSPLRRLSRRGCPRAGCNTGFVACVHTCAQDKFRSTRRPAPTGGSVSCARAATEHFSGRKRVANLDGGYRWYIYTARAARSRACARRVHAQRVRARALGAHAHRCCKGGRLRTRWRSVRARAARSSRRCLHGLMTPLADLRWQAIACQRAI